MPFRRCYRTPEIKAFVAFGECLTFRELLEVTGAHTRAELGGRERRALKSPLRFYASKVRQGETSSSDVAGLPRTP